MARLGSYQNKASFSFLEEHHSKMVTQILQARSEEALFIAYLDAQKMVRLLSVIIRLIYPD